MKYLPFLILLFVVLGCGKDQQTQSAPPTPAPAPVSVTAYDLTAAYKANEIAADERFGNRQLQVAGTVERIEETMGSMQVTLAGNEMIDVLASIAESDRAKVSKLSKGQMVTIVGANDGMTLGLYVGLSDCVIK